MVFDAKLGSTTIADVQVIDRTHPPLVEAMEVKAAQGTLATGLLVSKDANSKIIPYANDNTENLGTGDGAETNFTGTLAAAPVHPGSIAITDGTQNVTDDGLGHLIGDGSGTIEYTSGAIDVTFDAAPAGAASVDATYANKADGILVRKVDSTKETVGSVLIHGTYVKKNILVGSAAAAAADLARLKPLLIGL